MEGILFVVIGLFIVGGLAYMALKPKDKDRNQGKDAYFFLVSFISLGLLYWAIADLLRIWLADILGVTVSYYRAQNTIRDISLRLSTIIVAFPVFGFHWYKATFKKLDDLDIQGKRSYCMGILVLTTLMCLGGGTGLVYQGMNSALGISSGAASSLSFLIPYTLLAAGLWVYHFREWKALDVGDKATVTKNNQPTQVE